MNNQKNPLNRPENAYYNLNQIWTTVFELPSGAEYEATIGLDDDWREVEGLENYNWEKMLDRVAWVISDAVEDWYRWARRQYGYFDDDDDAAGGINFKVWALSDDYLKDFVSGTEELFEWSAYKLNANDDADSDGSDSDDYP